VVRSVIGDGTLSTVACRRSLVARKWADGDGCFLARRESILEVNVAALLQPVQHSLGFLLVGVVEGPHQCFLRGRPADDPGGTALVA
jgi:hypothetical protein